MAFLGFSDDAAMYDSTSLDNMFIVESLPSAPESFLKVYIYARMLALHPEMGDLDELQRALKLPEDSLEEAFTYWERAGLMRRVSDDPPRYVFLPARGACQSEMDRDYYKYRDFNGALQSLFADAMLHPAQYALANDWLNVLGFTQDAVIALVRHTMALSRSKSPDPARVFKNADKRAAQLADAGITDAEGIEREFARDDHVDQIAREVIRQFGLKRRPTEPETALARKWIREWEYSLDDILTACSETVKAQNPSFAYIDKILENRRSDTGAYASVKAMLSHLGSRIAPTPEQCRWYDARIAEGFEQGALEMAAAQQARKGNSSFDALDSLVTKWRERGLLTAAQVEEFVTRGRALLAEFTTILAAAGIEKRPTEDDLTAFEAWKQALPADVIVYAAESAKGRSYPISFMRNQIERWISSGKVTLEAVKARDDAPRRTSDNRPVNPALDYEQRSYAGKNFDDDFFMEEARKYIEQNGGDGTDDK